MLQQYLLPYKHNLVPAKRILREKRRPCRGIWYLNVKKLSRRQLWQGAVHILRQPLEGGKGVSQMLTIADEGGRGGSAKSWRLLTKGGRVGKKFDKMGLRGLNNSMTKSVFFSLNILVEGGRANSDDCWRGGVKQMLTSADEGGLKTSEIGWHNMWTAPKLPVIKLGNQLHEI